MGDIKCKEQSQPYPLKQTCTESAPESLLLFVIAELQEHEYIMQLKAINEAEDNESVKMLNYFREHCMFDHSSESCMKAQFPLQCGLTVKKQERKSTRESWLASGGSPGIFSSTQPRWPYCASKQIEWLAP